VAGGELVSVQARCASLRVLVSPEEIVSGRSGGIIGSVGLAGGGGSIAFTVPANTHLSWLDGSPAGVTLARITPATEVATKDEMRRCFRWSIRRYWAKRINERAASEFILCAPRAVLP